MAVGDTLGELHARGWMGLVFQRGGDWETKDPSEGWTAGWFRQGNATTLKRLWGGEVRLLRVASQEAEVDNGAGRRCGGPRVGAVWAAGRRGEERRGRAAAETAWDPWAWRW